MVDPIHLVLLKDRPESGVEEARRVEVPPERLLDDDLGLVRLAEVPAAQAAQAQVLDDRTEHRRRGRNVEKALHLAADAPLDLRDTGRQPVEARLLVVSPRHIRRGGAHLRPDLGVQLAAGELLDRPGRHRPELLVGDGLPAVAHQVEVRGKEVVVAQVVDRRDELPGREVAGRAEDDHDRRRGAAVLAQALQERVSVGIGHGRP